MKGRVGREVKTFKMRADETNGKPLREATGRFVPDGAKADDRPDAPDGQADRGDGLVGVRKSARVQLASGDRSVGSQHSVDGLVAAPQIHPQLKRRGGAEVVGVESAWPRGEPRGSWSSHWLLA